MTDKEIKAIKESYSGKASDIDKLTEAIESHNMVMLYAKKVTGQSETIIIQPKEIKVVVSKRQVIEPIIIGTKPSAGGKYVQYYLNKIFAIEVVDPAQGFLEGGATVSSVPQVFSGSKFENWGHFSEEKTNG